MTPSQGSLTSPRLRPAPRGPLGHLLAQSTPQVQGSNTVTTPVAVQAGEARVLSLSLNRQGCRSLSVSVLVKKPPFKAAAQFPFPLGYLSPHLSRGCSKNSSDKAMPCCFQQGGRASDRGSATCTGCGAGSRDPGAAVHRALAWAAGWAPLPSERQCEERPHRQRNFTRDYLSQTGHVCRARWQVPAAVISDGALACAGRFQPPRCRVPGRAHPPGRPGRWWWAPVCLFLRSPVASVSSLPQGEDSRTDTGSEGTN